MIRTKKSDNLKALEPKDSTLYGFKIYKGNEKDKVMIDNRITSHVNVTKQLIKTKDWKKK